MIQRVQSIYLFIITILLAIALFQPVWKNKGYYTSQKKEGFLKLTTTETFFLATSGDGSPLEEEPKDSVENPENQGMVKVSENYYIAGLLILSGLISLITIFQFRKRMLQVKLCSFNYLLLSGILLTYYLAIKNANALLSNADKGDFLFGFYAPIIAILFNFLAIRFIRKDEALVRSVDRLR